MTPETVESIKTHALMDYPREACGLVVVIKGRERYWRCNNVAPKPEDDFRLDPADYAAAEDAGEVVAVVHSHPNVPARPSPADLVQCETWGLPWLIVSVMPGPIVAEIHRFEPSGYQAPLVGRPFHYGVLDCYTLCRDWYAREANLILPEFSHGEDGWWDDGHSSLYMEHFEAAGFVAVGQADAVVLQRGDGILMQIRSKNGVPNHAGVYLGDGQFLHHLHGRLSSRDVYGGMWRDYTRLIVRHRNFTA